jgi:5-(carboxyamino)imidazole ribonucleotide mutase
MVPAFAHVLGEYTGDHDIAIPLPRELEERECSRKNSTTSNTGYIMANSTNPLVTVVMGSKSDWDVMRNCADTLSRFGIPYECRVLSAHRTPALLIDYIRTSEANGAEVFIAAAGGAAHLAGVVAGHTVLPVLGIPMETKSLGGLDSLLSTVQMPAGIPVATLAIGKAGAVNAALLAISILSVKRPELRAQLQSYRAEQAARIAAEVLD